VLLSVLLVPYHIIRLLIVKSNESNSWFIEIKNILRKYNMLEAWWYLDNAPKKAI
jgi:hypothetical protein